MLIVSIELCWEKPEQILHVVFGERWTDEEYNAAVDQANVMIRGIEHKVAILLDVERSSLRPQSNVFTQGKRTFTQMPPNVDHIFIIGGNTFTRAMMSTFFKVYNRPGLDIQVVSSKAEALERLNFA